MVTRDKIQEVGDRHDILVQKNNLVLKKPGPCGPGGRDKYTVGNWQVNNR